jgi:ABC-type cobalamin transport system ATPase subunit
MSILLYLQLILFTYDNTILPNLHVVANSGGLDDRISSYVDVISNLHWVIVEIAAVGLIWRPTSSSRSKSIAPEQWQRTS